MGLAAGRLRHRVRIEALIPVLDTDDEVRGEEWVDAFGALLPAAIEPLSGRELVAAAATQSKVTTRVVMRYRAGILPSMRVNHRGETLYNIEAVVPDPKTGRTWVTLHCTSGVNAG